MAHFNFHNVLSELSQFSHFADIPRSQTSNRKIPDDGIPGLSSLPNTKSQMTMNSTNTPSSRKYRSQQTPSKTPRGTRSHSKTPKKTPKTPGQDRFIPSRALSDIERANYIIQKSEDIAKTTESAAQTVYQSQLTNVLCDGQKPNDARILNFKERVPECQNFSKNHHKVLFSSSQPSTSSTGTRQIRQQPERILDAPCMLDDYYLNLIDWASSNHLIVALGPLVYLWNANDGAISNLTDVDNEEDYISSVKAMPDGSIVALGSSTGRVQLWDIQQQKCLRTMSGHTARVGTLSWNTYILSSGARSGMIHHHDVRVPDHHVGSISAHTQEVCGLAWSPDGRELASGGNDNHLNIWDMTLGNVSTPLLNLTEHLAAVKGVAWCPWQPRILASGGGTLDRRIRLWNTASGRCINSIDTQAQVCAMLWSNEHKELISGHGYSQYQLSIWKYPNMTKVVDLTGHTARILSLAMSPDGTTVVSAAADETLRLWKCFEKLPSKSAKKMSTTKNTVTMASHKSIR